MISNIIKRDGQVVPFSAEKINGWGEWAAQSLGGYVDWSGIVMRTVGSLPETCSSQDLQSALIRECLNMDSWSHNRMAGRLFASDYHKALYGKDKFPTVQELHRRLHQVGFMVQLDYSDEEYAEVEEIINHDRDFNYAHFQLKQIREKYALRNRVNGDEYETPQFVFMRMAMALAVDQPRDRRMYDLKRFYSLFSNNKINAPTPNYVNLGTKLRGYASCCLYTTKDTWRSLLAGDDIAYTMTCMSAGIGAHIRCRSLGDMVRGGMIKHNGKLPYLRSLVGSVRANIQNGRAGACTVYFSAYDPEVESLLLLKNPMTPVDRQIRGMDYNMTSNKFLARKADREESIFLFNCESAPDLYEAQFSKIPGEFERLYEKYENDPNFKKTYVPARKIVLSSLNEAYETGRAYLAFSDEINRHTPFKDPIYSSNLCVEIAEPTEGYERPSDLYIAGPIAETEVRFTNGQHKTFKSVDAISISGKLAKIAAVELKEGDRLEVLAGEAPVVDRVIRREKEPEVALCSLGALVVTNLRTDEEYEEAAYYCALMIDKCIHLSEYELPHVGYTAKNRMSAGIGMMDLAHHMARKKLSYASVEGKKEIHRIAERHAYYCIKASLRLGKELGNAPWMHRTLWPEGWLPIDTYNRNVDKIVGNELHYPWETLRAEIIENKGIRNSVVIALMPGESSSKASGTVNSVYPARDVTLIKTDNDITTYWAAPESDRLGKWYETAWSVPTMDLIDCYGILQKFNDQAISADFFREISGSEKITTGEMLEIFFHMQRVGMKTRYYQNTKTSKAVTFDQKPTAPLEPDNPKIFLQVNEIVGVAMEGENFVLETFNEFVEKFNRYYQFAVNSLNMTEDADISSYILMQHYGNVAEQLEDGDCVDGGCKL